MINWSSDGDALRQRGDPGDLLGGKEVKEVMGTDGSGKGQGWGWARGVDGRGQEWGTIEKKGGFLQARDSVELN
ncbi:hypothetical protein E2C01_062881 [Portunus trituberculatus]|uniref:Uncharacterized protein n=1 Tax=Portunus trituberculatus TaxID=210409 RepID=A0A5B7HHA6_PORTR|nr:hypothetical protein [Portunus trituberculatus]